MVSFVYLLLLPKSLSRPSFVSIVESYSLIFYAVQSIAIIRAEPLLACCTDHGSIDGCFSLDIRAAPPVMCACLLLLLSFLLFEKHMMAIAVSLLYCGMMLPSVVSLLHCGTKVAFVSS
jgi:hypothetical protein